MERCHKVRNCKKAVLILHFAKLNELTLFSRPDFDYPVTTSSPPEEAFFESPS
jgi:hypothetical protein